MRNDDPSFDDPLVMNKILTNFSRELGKSRLLLWRLFTDPEVSLWVKLIPILSFLYWLSPFDVFLIPFLGVTPIDDIAVIVLGLKLFIELCPQDLVNQLRDEINYGPSADDNGEVIDATYHILDDD